MTDTSDCAVLKITHLKPWRRDSINSWMICVVHSSGEWFVNQNHYSSYLSILFLQQRRRSTTFYQSVMIYWQFNFVVQLLATEKAFRPLNRNRIQLFVWRVSFTSSKDSSTNHSNQSSPIFQPRTHMSWIDATKTSINFLVAKNWLWLWTFLIRNCF